METQLTDFEAYGIAEGFIEAESKQQVLQAWSHIGKKGLHLVLQGFFGKTLNHLVESGILTNEFEINEDVLV